MRVKYVSMKSSPSCRSFSSVVLSPVAQLCVMRRSSCGVERREVDEPSNAEVRRVEGPGVVADACEPGKDDPSDRRGTDSPKEPVRELETWSCDVKGREVDEPSNAEVRRVEEPGVAADVCEPGRTKERRIASLQAQAQRARCHPHHPGSM